MRNGKAWTLKGPGLTMSGVVEHRRVVEQPVWTLEVETRVLVLVGNSLGLRLIDQ